MNNDETMKGLGPKKRKKGEDSSPPLIINQFSIIN